MMTKYDLSEAVSKALAIAKRAVKNDSWMTPTDDEADDPDCQADYGAYFDKQVEGWEQTCQFQMQWGQELSDLAEETAEAQGVAKIDNWECWYYEFYAPLKDEFWEAWASGHKLDQYWQAHIAKQ